jgi:hypothetical protein
VGGDTIVSLGAVTGIQPNQNSSTFQLAIYTEVNSAPGELVAATADITSIGVDDGSTNNAAVTKALDQPLNIPSAGNYWIMLLVGPSAVTVVANNSAAPLPIRCGTGFNTWPTQATSLNTGTQCLPVGDTNIGIAIRIYAVVNPA